MLRLLCTSHGCDHRDVTSYPIPGAHTDGLHDVSLLTFLSASNGGWRLWAGTCFVHDEIECRERRREQLIGGGPWVVVYTRGPLLWQQATAPGRVLSSGNQVWSPSQSSNVTPCTHVTWNMVTIAECDRIKQRSHSL